MGRIDVVYNLILTIYGAAIPNIKGGNDFHLVEIISTFLEFAPPVTAYFVAARPNPKGVLEVSGVQNLPIEFETPRWGGRLSCGPCRTYYT